MRLIKITDESPVMYLLMGYGTVTIVAILLVYFRTNDLVGIIMSLLFLSKVTSSFIIIYEHIKNKSNGSSALYDFFVRLLVSISVGYEEHYTSSVQQGSSKLGNQTKNVFIDLHERYMVSGKNEDLFYVPTEPKHHHYDLVFCHPGKCSVYVIGAPENQKLSLQRLLQPGADMDPLFKCWSASFGLDIWFYIIY